MIFSFLRKDFLDECGLSFIFSMLISNKFNLGICFFSEQGLTHEELSSFWIKVFQNNTNIVHS
uniref:Uncharacterized protein n=1 Tax=Lepeophtheirus salmonis TaxID=72036 RepID=A0A0K2V3E9_LEPSM